MLAGWGNLQIKEAATGVEGLQSARSVRPDLVVLDLQLPDLGGCEVMERLRADPATASIPVVICTSASLTSQQARWLGSAAAVLSKTGLTQEVLRRVLSDVLPGRQPLELQEPWE